MASEGENDFNLTAPWFLTTVDWNNSNHRRSIAASLVEGVYNLDNDRRQNHHGPQALAPPWWEFFNFRLVQVLVDNHDLSYFGAIFEFNSPYHNQSGQRPPQYVIAFRGTVNEPGDRKQDFKLDLHLMFNDLEKSSRFEIGLESVCQIVQKVGPGNVWLAGQSLGSSMALVLGRHMVKHTGAHLETYLFNPPFASAPIELIKNDKLKTGLRFANSLLTAGLAAAVNHGGQREGNHKNDHFTVLSTWVPYLFINRADPICSEYVGYFKHREDMESIGAGEIGRLATKHSMASILLGVTGNKDSEAFHLIPTAYLTVNTNPCHSLMEAHGINQWWRQDLQFEYKYYQYK